ncbi:ead/Ea22-like family protein, partial [Salmonella enterica]|nr:ead/Ea22-like family protein [Salmonella enterica]
KRLAHSLRKANPDSKLQSDAMDYLSRKGLIGVKDILR